MRFTLAVAGWIVQFDPTFENRVWYALFSVVGVVAVGAVFVLASTYVFIILGGVILAILAATLIAQVRAVVDLPRWAAFFVVWIVLIGLPVLILVFALPNVTAQLSNLGSSLATLGQEDFWSSVPGGERIASWISAVNMQSFLDDPGLSGRLGGVALTITSGVVGFALLLFIGLLGSFEPKLYRRSFLALIPRVYRDVVEARMKTISDTLTWWIIGRLSSMFAVTVLTYVGLLVLGVEFAFILALIAGLLSFVPNIGPILSGIPAVLVAFTQGGLLFVYVILLYVFVQTIESYFITPFIQQWAVHVPPALLLAVEIIFGVLFGVIGIIVAEPVLAVVIAFLRKRTRTA